MSRYYIKTGYHYWIVVDRKTGKNMNSYNARTYGGDRSARQAAQDACTKLNAAEDAPVPTAQLHGTLSQRDQIIERECSKLYRKA